MLVCRFGPAVAAAIAHLPVSAAHNMKAFRHPVTFALVAEALSLLLLYFSPYNWTDDPMSSPSFWLVLPHIPAFVLSSAVLQPESEIGKTVALVVPTFIIWVLLFYATRLVWRYSRRNHAR